MAGSDGFEPSEELLPRLLSRQVVSASSPNSPKRRSARRQVLHIQHLLAAFVSQWCLFRDSNPNYNDFESFSSTNWDKKAYGTPNRIRTCECKIRSLEPQSAWRPGHMVLPAGFEPAIPSPQPGGLVRQPIGVKWFRRGSLVGVIASLLFPQVNVVARSTGHPVALQPDGGNSWGRTRSGGFSDHCNDRICQVTIKWSE